MRYGLGRRIMPIQTLRAILTPHSTNLDEYVYAFSWRHGPKGKVTIYDLNYPRRNPPTEDDSHGWAQEEWWIHSTVLSVSDIEMGPYTGLFWEAACEACEWSYVDVKPHRDCLRCGQVVSSCVKTPGYKNVITGLLSTGSIVPSRCLSDWLEDDSRKWAVGMNRLRYLEN